MILIGKTDTTQSSYTLPHFLSCQTKVDLINNAEYQMLIFMLTTNKNRYLRRPVHRKGNEWMLQNAELERQPNQLQNPFRKDYLSFSFHIGSIQI